MKVSLSEHFNYKNIFKMTLSPILMMIFTSLYTVVDGFFIANYSSEDAFAGVNLIWPILMIIGGIGFMFGVGGSALTSMYLGMKDKERANKSFTTMVIFTFLAGLVISFLGCLLIRPISVAMGNISSTSSEGMVNEAIKYGRILAIAQVGFMLQNLFQSYFIVNETPRLGFIFTLAAGLTNMILDGVFIAVLKLGTIGAALATISGYIIGGVGPLIYFIRNKNGNICLVRTKMIFNVIIRACSNGFSEFVNNTASSIVGVAFNIQLLRYYGQIGVSAYGVIGYVCFIFIAIFVGYCIGMSPVISYNYGAKNNTELKNVYNKSLILIFIASVLMVTSGELLSRLLAHLFASGDMILEDLATKALRIYSISFAFCGFSIYFSNFFTALNNGMVSAIISFFRTLVFQIVLVFLLPLIIGGDGIFYAISISEILSVIMALCFIIANKKKYGY